MDTHSSPTDGGHGDASAPSTILVAPRRGFFARFGKLLLFALIISVMINFAQYAAYEEFFAPKNGVRELHRSGPRGAVDKIAIIHIDGAIISEDGYIKRQIDAVKRDEAIKAIVLRVDSPGGTVTASDYLYHHLKKLTEEREIPIVVSMGGLCASGGYYLSMAVGDTPDSIFAEPSTWTGSIGVVIPHYDLSGLLEKFQVEEDGIVSGAFKQMGNPAREMTPEDRAILQSLVDDSFEGFKEVVREGRPSLRDDPAALDAVADGRIFSAKQALDVNLIDQIGFIEDALERAAELGNVNVDNVRVVEYEKVYTSLVDLIAGVEARGQSGINVESLIDLSSPRAYYLWSWAPAEMIKSGQ